MKRAFTLLEIVISIFIFSLIAIYLYQTIDAMQKSNEINSNRFDKDARAEKIVKLFYNDIFSQIDIYANANIVKESEFDIFYLHTKNSIHGMINPYVAYFVRNDSLFRIESKIPIKILLNQANVESVKIDKLMDNAAIFRIYENKNSYLINYKDENDFVSFQISLPQNADKTANGSFNSTSNGTRRSLNHLN